MRFLISVIFLFALTSLNSLDEQIRNRLIKSGYFEKPGSLIEMINFDEKKRFKSDLNGKSHNFRVCKEIDEINYEFFFDTKIGRDVNYLVVAIGYKDEKIRFFKTNLNIEKGSLEHWEDLNGDKQKQDDEIFYLWY